MSTVTPEQTPPSSSTKTPQTEEKGISSLGCLLTAVVGLGAAILAGYIYANNAMGQANSFDALGNVMGTLALVVGITLVVVGGITYQVLLRVLPEKPKTTTSSSPTTAENRVTDK